MSALARAALTGALVAALTSCGSGDEIDQSSAGATARTSTESAPSTSASATASTTAAPSPSASAPSPPDACALLDVPSLEGAGLTVDPPRPSAIRASDGAEATEALQGRDALLMCDAGFTASAQINDMPDETQALQEATVALDVSANTPTAVRRDLDPARVPFGATVVDPDVQTAAVQFQLRDLHVAVVLSYGGAGELSVEQVEQLLQAQLDQALTVLG